jgi:transcriptional regulator with XRE-family HTH domain
MKILSTAKLARIVSERRGEMGLTQEQLGEQTSLHRVMVGRIEREDFIPSIVQLQALSSVLGFEITDLFVEQNEEQSFIALRSELMSEGERQGFDTLLSMMLTLRQQMVLRSTYEDKHCS